MEKPFNSNSWVLRAPDATIMLVDDVTEMEIGFITEDDFSMKFRITFYLFNSALERVLLFTSLTCSKSSNCSLISVLWSDKVLDDDGKMLEFYEHSVCYSLILGKWNVRLVPYYIFWLVY